MKAPSKMLRVFLLLAMIIVCAQAGMINNSAYIVISSGTYLNVEQNYTSSGTATITGSGVMNLKGNFVNNNSSGNPLSTSETISFSGSSQQQISGNSTAFGNVTVSNAAGLQMASDASVAGNLTLSSGNLDLNAQDLVLGSSALLAETGGRVMGEGSISTTRSLSNVDANIAGLGVKITEDGDLGATTILRAHVPRGTTGIERFFHINTANSPTNATLVFNYFDAELNGVTESSLQLFKSVDSDEWTEQLATLDAEANTLTLSGINSFSYWTAAATGTEGALPITLKEFIAVYDGKGVVLTWETESEMANANFLIYRNDEVIASLEGAGTSSEPHSYSYIDRMTIPGITYTYVLADVNLDNDEYKHLDKAVCVTTPEQVIPLEYALDNNYPNPFNPSTTLNYHLPLASKVEYAIYDLNGMIMMESSYDQEAGIHQMVWNASNAPSGIYLIRFKAQAEDGSKVFSTYRKATLLK